MSHFSNAQVSKILTNGSFDLLKYEHYSPVYLPTTFLALYFMNFAAWGVILVSIFLEYGVEWFSQPSPRRGGSLPKYSDITRWEFGFYMILTVLSMGFCQQLELPLWTIPLVELISFIFLVPIGMTLARKGVVVLGMFP